MRTSQHSRIQDLLGAYAADAVDPDEAEEVEEHLRTCDTCAAEVAEHRDTLALLAPASPGLRPQPFDSLDLDLSPPMGTITPLRKQTRSVPAWTMSVAAAIVFLVAAVAVTQARRAEDLSAQLAGASVEAAAAQALEEPGTRTLTLRSESGQAYAEVTLTQDGRGYLLPRDLPDLAPDLTYQLWALKGPERTSLIVAGSDPEVVEFRTSPDIDGLALTEELAGGAPQPTKTPVAVAFLRTT